MFLNENSGKHKTGLGDNQDFLYGTSFLVTIMDLLDLSLQNNA